MKKISIAVVALTIALVGASVAGAAFTRNLSVGSTGADVAELQTVLMSKGYSIPALAAGTAKGYFGSQTLTAVKAYQAANGVPSTGFVGPLTLAKLNGGSTVTTAMTLPFPCPVGYVVPAGWVCPGTTTTTGTGTGTTGISTPGAVGTLAASLWTTPSGVIAYKGQSYDIASYKLQASASDMALQNLTLDFDARLWLYASAVTVKDDAGVVVGQVNNLNSGNFSELTVGSQYRLSVPVSNYVVRSTQIKYLTVNVTFLPTSDRSTGTVNVTQVQVRSVDGTGVTDTATVTDDRSFTYQGSGAGSIIVTTDSASPAAGLVGVSTSVQTQNVTLAIFDVKSQNAGSTLRKVDVVVRTLGNASVGTLFSNIKLVAGGQTYSANTITANASPAGVSSSTVSFQNLTIPLAADVYVPLKIVADVAVNTNNTLDNTYSTTTLVAAGTAGGTTNNPVVEDSSYNTLDINEATFASNPLNFTSSSLSAASLARTYGTQTVNSTTGSTTQKVTFSFALTAGNNPIYISKTQNTALSTSSTLSGMTITSVDFADNDTNGDGTTFFYLSPGQTKTFTAIYQASGAQSATGVLSVTSINFGTSTAAMTSGALNSSDVSNTLKAVLFN